MTGDQHDALYREQGHWARHYSVVRMTIATAGFTILFSILGVATQNGLRDLAHVATWYIGGAVTAAFVLFTILFEVSNQRHRKAWADWTGNERVARWTCWRAASAVLPPILVIALFVLAISLAANV